MSVSVGRRVSDRDLPRYSWADRSTSWWGTLGLIATESMLFAFMLFAYFYTASTSVRWPPAGIPKPDLTLPIVSTCLLFLSCLSVAVAEWGIKHGQRWLLISALGGTFALGAAFAGIQVFSAWGQPFSAQSSAYGSLFVTINGLHDVHAFVGLLMLMFTLLRAMMGHFSRLRYAGIQVVGLYWYFIFAVWMAVFVSLYLAPYAFGHVG